MKVLIWCCGFKPQFAGQYIYNEAKRQGLNVYITGSRSNPGEAVEACKKLKPDWVFCLVLTPNMPQFYKEIRKTGAKLLLWYPDQTEKSRDNMWKNQLNNVADVLVFSILETAIRYKYLAKTVLWMPQYFDEQFCMKDGELPERLNSEKEIFDVCFIGGTDSRRNEQLAKLQKHFKCNFYLDGIRKRKEVRGYEMASIYAQSKIAINIQRSLFMNRGPFVTSNRVYNAMGSGCFFINQYVNEIERLFEMGTDCVMYDDSIEGLVHKIIYYLRNETLRETIAATGQQLILEFHTLEQRVKEYWKVMSLISAKDVFSLTNSFPGFGKWVQP